MKLNKLTLSNFKGIKELELLPQGGNMTILGENGTGKTTVADAYAWVTFGKNFSGESIEQEIKLRDPETGLTPNDGGVVHAVEAELLLDSGSTFTLRKEYAEKWVKKRGAAESEFQGNTTTYYIDGVPLQKKEYDRRVAEVIPEEAGRLLSMPLYFCTNLKWPERRKILMDMCGTVSDADIFKIEELSPLEKLLEGKSIDDYRKVLKAQMKKVNEELKSIPARIDELEKMDEETGEIKEVVMAHLKDNEAKRSEMAAKLARLENGGEAAELQKDLAGIEAEMTTVKADFEAQYKKKKCEAETNIRRCETEIEHLGEKMAHLQDKIQKLEAANETTEKLAQNLRDEWGVVNAKEPEITVSDVCPCCGQKLPPEKLQEARDKAIADFNLKKSQTLSEITTKGKRMMAQKAKNDQEIKEIRGIITVLEKQISELADRRAREQEELSSLTMPEADNTAVYQGLEEKRKAVQEKIDALFKGDSSEEIEAIRIEIQSYDTVIAVDNEKLAAIAQAENVQKRKAELSARQKELGKIFNELEKNLNLTEKFIREKIRLTEDSINSHFKHVRFVMFRQQINGGIEECCEPTIDGVPFGAGLNTGAEMKAALDILNALSDYFKLNLPVFIDNCESYTSDSLIPVENQLIRLVVAEGQKNLAVEIEGQEKHEIKAVIKAAA